MATDQLLAAGKLPAAALERMLSRLPRADPRVLIGPRLGEDAAVLACGDRYLVAATDPVTFASDRIGWYCVHVNANDVAVLGADPRWFFAVLLLPEGQATTAMAETITADIVETCRALDVSLCGGHTEVTIGLDRPIVVGHMLGEVEHARLVRKDALQVGDRILLTRGAAVEGTAILARERADLCAARLDPVLVARAQALLFEPGITIVDAARTAMAAGRVRAMHDPTEGGIATGLWELAHAGGRGLRVWNDAIPILPETEAVCAAFGLDPLKLVASGALLIAAEPDEADRIAQALVARGIPVADIGQAQPAEDGIQIQVSGQWVALEPADRDEIARVFGQ
jgi:hydrogenase expression/formation protein HypE